MIYSELWKQNGLCVCVRVSLTALLRTAEGLPKPECSSNSRHTL